jgi:protein-tyrosine-phosphatase
MTRREEEASRKYPYHLFEDLRSYDEALDEMSASKKDGEPHIPTFARRMLERLRDVGLFYLLRREFEEYSCKLSALNDRGDDSPEGELTNGILDQLAKFERAKTAERMRRGRLKKAREGKIVAGPVPNYGFRFDATKEGYVVYEPEMSVVRRICRMVGVEGLTLHAVAKTLEQEGVLTATGGKHWDVRVIKNCIVDDVYKPHTFEEIEELVAPEVAARLDPEKSYGVWWYNRRQVKTTHVSEAGPEGKRYAKRVKYTPKPKDQWIAVPVPDSGVPRAVLEAARDAVRDNHRSPASRERFWELAGGVLYCASCGRRMTKHTGTYYKLSREKVSRYYYRCPRAVRHKDVCSQTKHFRADEVEPAVWGLISDLLKDPDLLRTGLERMIEEERRGWRGDPEREAKAWLEKLTEVDRQRERAQDLAIQGLLDYGELRAKLAALAETRETAEKELGALRSRRERMVELERDRDALLRSYVGMTPEALDGLAPEERHRVYRMLKLKVLIKPDGTLEASGKLLGKTSEAGAYGTKLCRSPMAQGVFEEVVRRQELEGMVEADSAGTHYYHLGEAPDQRAQKSMTRRGIDIGSQRARRLTSEDCREFDYILFMDETNRRLVEPLCWNGAAEVRLFLDYAPELLEREIPDPYYGDLAGFDHVIKLVESASEGLLEDIKKKYLAGRI